MRTAQVRATAQEDPDNQKTEDLITTFQRLTMDAHKNGVPPEDISISLVCIVAWWAACSMTPAGRVSFIAGLPADLHIGIAQIESQSSVGRTIQ